MTSGSVTSKVLTRYTVNSKCMYESEIDRALREKKEHDHKVMLMIRHQKSEESKATREAKCECSQCHMLMKKSIADAQIENNRENAPICLGCIMGYTRTPPRCGTKLSTT